MVTLITNCNGQYLNKINFDVDVLDQLYAAVPEWS
jgi:hypothetical protein